MQAQAPNSVDSAAASAASPPVDSAAASAASSPALGVGSVGSGAGGVQAADDASKAGDSVGGEVGGLRVTGVAGVGTGIGGRKVFSLPTTSTGSDDSAETTKGGQEHAQRQ